MKGSARRRNQLVAALSDEVLIIHATLGEQMNQIVYSLYGLTREEIAIIEESLQERQGSRAAADATAVEEDR